MNGLPIYVSSTVLEETDERLFPASRHRSQRIRKKLIKRFRGEFKKIPCMYTTKDALYMHPAKYAEFQNYMESHQ